MKSPALAGLVIPAEAGIQGMAIVDQDWIAAFATMTVVIDVDGELALPAK